MKIRIATFNIQHCNYYLGSMQAGREIIDFDAFADAINSFNPDILVLNEVRDKGDDPGYTEQAKILAEKAGYEYYRFGEAIRFGENDTMPYGNAMRQSTP